MGKNAPERRSMQLDKFYDAQPRVMFSSEAFQLELKEFHKQKPDIFLIGFKVNRVLDSTIELILEVGLPSGVGVIYLDAADVYPLKFPHTIGIDHDKGIEYICFPEYVRFSLHTQDFEHADY